MSEQGMNKEAGWLRAIGRGAKNLAKGKTPLSRLAYTGLGSGASGLGMSAFYDWFNNRHLDGYSILDMFDSSQGSRFREAVLNMALGGAGTAVGAGGAVLKARQIKKPMSLTTAGLGGSVAGAAAFGVMPYKDLVLRGTHYLPLIHEAMDKEPPTAPEVDNTARNVAMAGGGVLGLGALGLGLAALLGKNKPMEEKAKLMINIPGKGPNGAPAKMEIPFDAPGLSDTMYDGLDRNFRREVRKNINAGARKRDLVTGKLIDAALWEKKYGDDVIDVEAKSASEYEVDTFYTTEKQANSLRKEAMELCNEIYNENPAWWPYGLNVDNHEEFNLVREKATQKLAGFVGWQEFNEGNKRVGSYSVGIKQEFRGKGLAKEAVAKVLAQKSACVDEVRAYIIKGNSPSTMLAQSLGLGDNIVNNF